MLDEIQYAPNVPSIVKYLYDAAQTAGQPGIKFILTGSSSFYLKHLFTESLSGRKVVFEMFPLSFGEFLAFRGVAYRPRASLADMVFDPYEYERLKGHYEEYLAHGGLPEVALAPTPETKTEILNDVLSSYINIDIRVLADFQKIAELQQLLPRAGDTHRQQARPHQAGEHRRHFAANPGAVPGVPGTDLRHPAATGIQR